MQNQITNSHLSRKADKSAVRHLRQAFQSVTQGDGNPVFSQEAIALRKLLEGNNMSNVQIGEVFLDLIMTDKLNLFDKTFQDYVTNNNLGAFHISVIGLENCAQLGTEEEFSRITEIVVGTLGGNLPLANILELKQARARIRQSSIQIKLLEEQGRINRLRANVCYDINTILIDALDVQENICCDRIIYADTSFAITWYAVRLEDNSSFASTGELTIAIKRPNGLWSFDKYADTRIPISSLRQAREACLKWRGQQMRGQITHAESRRIAKFLGFKVTGKSACLGIKHQQRGFGFGQKHAQ